jgi:hypothetical protein
MVNDAPANFPLGATTVTWTVIDIHGNTNTCAQVVTVTDGEAPVVSCPVDQNVSANAACEFVIADYTGAAFASATDNCDTDVTIAQSPAAGVTVSGTTTVTLTATDDAGNTDTCTFQVIVEDTTNPTITTCASDVTELVDGACNLSLPNYTGLIVADDNCTDSDDLIITQSPVAGTTINGHGTVTTVTITVADANGNTTTCDFEVTLQDDIAPTITCDGAVTQTADAGQCGAVVDLEVPATADNCGVVSVINDYNNGDRRSRQHCYLHPVCDHHRRPGACSDLPC